MSMDLNRKIVTKNAFRVTKDRSKTALRVIQKRGEITREIDRKRTRNKNSNLHL